MYRTDYCLKQFKLLNFLYQNLCGKINGAARCEILLYRRVVIPSLICYFCPRTQNIIKLITEFIKFASELCEAHHNRFNSGLRAAWQMLNYDKRLCRLC